MEGLSLRIAITSSTFCGSERLVRPTMYSMIFLCGKMVSRFPLTISSAQTVLQLFLGLVNHAFSFIVIVWSWTMK
jgi:hypothetical protein